MGTFATTTNVIHTHPSSFFSLPTLDATDHIINALCVHDLSPCPSYSPSLSLEKLHLWLNPTNFRFYNCTQITTFCWRKTSAVLTGDWPHFVFMIANLKWTLSTGRQPCSWSTPQSPIWLVNAFPILLEPRTPLPHGALLVDDVVSHFTKKIIEIKREGAPCSPPPSPWLASMLLSTAFLPVVVGERFKTSICVCSLTLFLPSHSRTYSYIFLLSLQYCQCSFPLNHRNWHTKYAVIDVLKISFDLTSLPL